MKWLLLSLLAWALLSVPVGVLLGCWFRRGS